MDWCCATNGAQGHGLPPGEEHSSRCSFWAENYVREGDIGRASRSSGCSPCATTSAALEEYTPPLAASWHFRRFSHVALVTTGLNLDRAPDSGAHPAAQRAQDNASSVTAEPALERPARA